MRGSVLERQLDELARPHRPRWWERNRTADYRLVYNARSDTPDAVADSLNAAGELLAAQFGNAWEYCVTRKPYVEAVMDPRKTFTEGLFDVLEHAVGFDCSVADVTVYTTHVRVCCGDRRKSHQHHKRDRSGRRLSAKVYRSAFTSVGAQQHEYVLDAHMIADAAVVIPPVGETVSEAEGRAEDMLVLAGALTEAGWPQVRAAALEWMTLEQVHKIVTTATQMAHHRKRATFVGRATGNEIALCVVDQVSRHIAIRVAAAKVGQPYELVGELVGESVPTDHIEEFVTVAYS